MTKLGTISSTRPFAALALLLVFAAGALALPQDKKGKQQPTVAPKPIAGTRQPGKDDEISIATDLVQLDVSVLDRGNRSVFDIPRERFTILEDNVPQKVDFFSKEQAPVSLAIVVDTSGSMRSKIESVVDSAIALARAKRPEDEVAIIGFKGDAELVQEFTRDQEDVEDALNSLIVGGSTSLLDATMVAADYVQKEGRNRRKALVIVSDGVEKNSFFTFDQVIEHVRGLDVRLYLIGFLDGLDEEGSIFRKSQKTKAHGLIDKLAGETGGRSFFPADTTELGTITDQISQDLRTVFVLGYYPSNTKKDGTYRHLEVRVATPDGKSDAKLTARTRSGYYADKQ